MPQRERQRGKSLPSTRRYVEREKTRSQRRGLDAIAKHNGANPVDRCWFRVGLLLLKKHVKRFGELRHRRLDAVSFGGAARMTKRLGRCSISVDQGRKQHSREQRDLQADLCRVRLERQ